MSLRNRMGPGSKIIKSHSPSGVGGAATAIKQAGPAMQGLISTTNRSINGAMVRRIRTRAGGGNSRHWTFCMNQLGGVGRRWGQSGPGNRGGVRAGCAALARESRCAHPVGDSCVGYRSSQYEIQFPIRGITNDNEGGWKPPPMAAPAIMRFLLPPGFSLSTKNLVESWNANFSKEVVSAWLSGEQSGNQQLLAALARAAPKTVLSIENLSSLVTVLKSSQPPLESDPLAQLPSLNGSEGAPVIPFLAVPGAHPPLRTAAVVSPTFYSNADASWVFPIVPRSDVPASMCVPPVDCNDPGFDGVASLQLSLLVQGGRTLDVSTPVSAFTIRRVR